MKQIVPILLLMIPFFCYSQQQTIDSLKRLLPTAMTDSAKFQLSYDIADNYRYIHYDSALFYADKSLLVAQRNRKELNIAYSLYTKGFLLSLLQRFPEAFQALTAALQIAEDPRNGNSFWNIAKLQVKDKDSRLVILASIHNGLGVLMQNAGRIDQTVYHYNESIKMYRAIGNSLGVAFANVNLGEIYWKILYQPDSALVFEQVAENIFKVKHEERPLGFVYNIMGASYLAKHKDSIGLAYLYKATSFSKKYNVQAALAGIYRVLADFYIQKKNKDSAFYYARIAASIHIPTFPMDLGDDFDNLAKSYELNQQQDSAYKYQGIALATYDSLYRNRIKGLTGFQQLSFDQQQQLQQLEAEKITAQNRTRMYFLFAGLGHAIFIGFFLYRNSQQQKRANLLLQEQKQQIQETLAELKSTQAQLIQSEKMASLGELTAGIAHEIQNPLNFVNNFSEINKELIEELRAERDNPQVQEEIMNDIEQNTEKIIHHGKRADSIVKGMLQHSKSSSGKKELTNINALVDESLRLSYHGLRAKDKSFNAAINTSFDESIGKINIIPQDISRVLLNLFNNAFYAMNEKKAKLNGTYEPAVSVCTKNFNGKAEIIVTDNGNGIPPNIIDKIFQPFFTTKPTGQGTGLGLSLSYDIIKAHGGQIKVESEEGKGTTFIIQL